MGFNLYVTNFLHMSQSQCISFSVDCVESSVTFYEPRVAYTMSMTECVEEIRVYCFLHQPACLRVCESQSLRSFLPLFVLYHLALFLLLLACLVICGGILIPMIDAGSHSSLQLGAATPECALKECRVQA